MSRSIHMVRDIVGDFNPMVYEDLSEGRRDYNKVRQALEFLSAHSRENPATDAIALHMGLAQSELEDLFRRWAGLGIEEFLQAISSDHARNMLHGSASLLELADILGASGPARLHDLLVSHETITLNEFRKKEREAEIHYGFHDCPFGLALVMSTGEGICGLGFCDEESQKASLLEEMKSRLAGMTFVSEEKETWKLIRQIFVHQENKIAVPIKIILTGSDFEIKVWEALLKVPAGRAVTFSDLAEHIESPGSHSAVGSAVNKNPISLVVPCHRVFRKDASLGGYHWGTIRKQAIIGWEAGKMKAEMEE